MAILCIKIINQIERTFCTLLCWSTYRLGCPRAN